MSVKAPVKNFYELVVVLKPNISEDELKKNISQIDSAIKNSGGTVTKVDEAFRRKFTHKVKGFKDGFYVSIQFSSPPEVPNVLKRTLSIAEDILNYILVRKEVR